MEIICKSCGEIFIPEPEDVAMYLEGWIDHLTPLCDECADMQDNEDYEYMNYSDADPGL